MMLQIFMMNEKLQESKLRIIEMYKETSLKGYEIFSTPKLDLCVIISYSEYSSINFCDYILHVLKINDTLAAQHSCPQILTPPSQCKDVLLWLYEEGFNETSSSEPGLAPSETRTSELQEPPPPTLTNQRSGTWTPKQRANTGQHEAQRVIFPPPARVQGRSQYGHVRPPSTDQRDTASGIKFKLGIDKFNTPVKPIMYEHDQESLLMTVRRTGTTSNSRAAKLKCPYNERRNLEMLHPSRLSAAFDVRIPPSRERRRERESASYPLLDEVRLYLQSHMLCLGQRENVLDKEESNIIIVLLKRFLTSHLPLYSSKAKSKYRNRIRLERASQRQYSDTHKTIYDRVKRCGERKKKNVKASERVKVVVFTQNKRQRERSERLAAHGSDLIPEWISKFQSFRVAYPRICQADFIRSGSFPALKPPYHLPRPTRNVTEGGGGNESSRFRELRISSTGAAPPDPCSSPGESNGCVVNVSSAVRPSHSQPSHVTVDDGWGGGGVLREQLVRASAAMQQRPTGCYNLKVVDLCYLLSRIRDNVMNGMRWSYGVILTEKYSGNRTSAGLQKCWNLARCHRATPLYPVSCREARGSDNNETATLIKCAIVDMRKVTNLRVVLYRLLTINRRVSGICHLPKLCNGSSTLRLRDGEQASASKEPLSFASQDWIPLRVGRGGVAARGNRRRLSVGRVATVPYTDVSAVVDDLAGCHGGLCTGAGRRSPHRCSPSCHATCCERRLVVWRITELHDDIKRLQEDYKFSQLQFRNCNIYLLIYERSRWGNSHFSLGRRHSTSHQVGDKIILHVVEGCEMDRKVDPLDDSRWRLRPGSNSRRHGPFFNVPLGPGQYRGNCAICTCKWRGSIKVDVCAKIDSTFALQTSDTDRKNMHLRGIANSSESVEAEVLYSIERERVRVSVCGRLGGSPGKTKEGRERGDAGVSTDRNSSRHTAIPEESPAIFWVPSLLCGRALAQKRLPLSHRRHFPLRFTTLDRDSAEITGWSDLGVKSCVSSTSWYAHDPILMCLRLTSHIGCKQAPTSGRRQFCVVKASLTRDTPDDTKQACRVNNNAGKTPKTSRYTTDGLQEGTRSRSEDHRGVVSLYRPPRGSFGAYCSILLEKVIAVHEGTHTRRTDLGRIGSTASREDQEQCETPETGDARYLVMSAASFWELKIIAPGRGGFLVNATPQPLHRAAKFPHYRDYYLQRSRLSSLSAVFVLHSTPYLLPFLARIPGEIFQQSNARPHVARKPGPMINIQQNARPSSPSTATASNQLAIDVFTIAHKIAEFNLEVVELTNFSDPYQSCIRRINGNASCRHAAISGMITRPATTVGAVCLRTTSSVCRTPCQTMLQHVSQGEKAQRTTEYDRTAYNRAISVPRKAISFKKKMLVVSRLWDILVDPTMYLLHTTKKFSTTSISELLGCTRPKRNQKKELEEAEMISTTHEKAVRHQLHAQMLGKYWVWLCWGHGRLFCVNTPGETNSKNSQLPPPSTPSPGHARCFFAVLAGRNIIFDPLAIEWCNLILNVDDIFGAGTPNCIPHFAIVGFSGLPPTIVANLKTHLATLQASHHPTTDHTFSMGEGSDESTSQGGGVTWWPVRIRKNATYGDNTRLPPRCNGCWSATRARRERDGGPTTPHAVTREGWAGMLMHNVGLGQEPDVPHTIAAADTRGLVCRMPELLSGGVWRGCTVREHLVLQDICPRSRRCYCAVGFMHVMKLVGPRPTDHISDSLPRLSLGQNLKPVRMVFGIFEAGMLTPSVQSNSGGSQCHYLSPSRYLICPRKAACAFRLPPPASPRAFNHVTSLRTRVELHSCHAHVSNFYWPKNRPGSFQKIGVPIAREAHEYTFLKPDLTQKECAKNHGPRNNNLRVCSSTPTIQLGYFFIHSSQQVASHNRLLVRRYRYYSPFEVEKRGTNANLLAVAPLHAFRSRDLSSSPENSGHCNFTGIECTNVISSLNSTSHIVAEFLRGYQTTVITKTSRRHDARRIPNKNVLSQFPGLTQTLLSTDSIPEWFKARYDMDVLKSYFIWSKRQSAVCGFTDEIAGGLLAHETVTVFANTHRTRTLSQYFFNAGSGRQSKFSRAATAPRHPHLRTGRPAQWMRGAEIVKRTPVAAKEQRSRSLDVPLLALDIRPDCGGSGKDNRAARGGGGAYGIAEDGVGGGVGRGMPPPFPARGRTLSEISRCSPGELLGVCLAPILHDVCFSGTPGRLHTSPPLPLMLDKLKCNPGKHTPSRSPSRNFLRLSNFKCLNVRKRETGDPRENSSISGIVRYDSHVRKAERDPARIEPGSAWWEASSLTAHPPWLLKIYVVCPAGFRFACLHIITVSLKLRLQTESQDSNAYYNQFAVTYKFSEDLLEFYLQPVPPPHANKSTQNSVDLKYYVRTGAVLKARLQTAENYYGQTSITGLFQPPVTGSEQLANPTPPPPPFRREQLSAYVQDCR
ncbi:hypothetical protein PR048_016856 [Dryococelus australis]|uniref:Uncharacterized protein n=1 Tax=Dryococelus australis TaxID=614101 RepID=A0ABQ9H7Y2_9NEOP|nr:hypothetical protein PR048_016856 [Dryococelus australis]